MSTIYDPDTDPLEVGTVVDDLLSESEESQQLDIFAFMKAHTHIGDVRTVLTESLKGMNHALIADGGKAGLELDSTLVSKVFITRPMLNMSTSQLIQNRKLASLLNTNPNSIERFVRMTLDPRLGAIGEEGKGTNILSCPLLDNENAFIPLLTNTFSNMSGWPNTTNDVSYSKAGIAKEESFIVDGTNEIYGKVELDLTFKRIKNDPTIKLMDTWVKVPSLQYRGVIQPYYDFIRADEYNYNCRIFRLMMSPDGRYVKHIACTGASAPISVDDGSVFNADDKDGPYANVGSESTYRFAGTGARYNDPLIIMEFNQVVGIFHNGMKQLDEGGLLHNMVVIPYELGKIANGKGYPRINLTTLELEWYIESGILDKIISDIED